MDFQGKRDILSFKGKIHLICKDDEVLACEKALSSVKVLGFDTETRPSFVKGQTHKVALLQLSTEREAFLFRLHGLSRFSLLKDLFEDPQVVKVGAAIRDDIKALQKLFPFEAKGFTELQLLAKEKGLTQFGLKGMTEELLGATIHKGPKMTNWEAQTLTDRQLNYAATDAWIGLKLFEKLTSI